MTRPHPALIALAVLCAVSLLGLWWTSEALQAAERELQWSGETPPPEVVQAWAWFTFAYGLVLPALSVAGAASAMGLVLVWCLPHLFQRSTRTMSAAGSARNPASTTVPNSSTSISDPSAAASISMSTERE